MRKDTSFQIWMLSTRYGHPNPRFRGSIPELGRPNLGFGYSNLRFEPPNPRFGDPNPGFGSPNPELGHPNP